NGKGSIAAMVASILSRGGFHVGLYTSPHLIDVRERIKVDGNMISPKEMIEWMEEVKKQSTENITYFEFLTAVAFLYFLQKRVDVAVIEVGMGGRLDATNVVTPLVSVISNISFDHEEYLGNRLENIAREKGGIIKNGGACITAVKQRRILELLEDICRKRGAKLYRVGRDIKVDVSCDGSFSYSGIKKRYHNLICPLKGRHQVENAAVALGVTEYIASRGFKVNDDAVFAGIRDVRWEGRLEVLQQKPMVIVDGAHNADGATILSRALKEEFAYRRLILIFGVLNDKDYKTMLKKLVPLSDCLVITKPDTARTMPPEIMMKAAQSYRKRVEVIGNSHEALKRALSMADPDDLICITGSLYLVGEIKRAFSTSSNKPQIIN
ncbi:MAG TPA: folylpolyglutamate synthase/dihydrofolate synthase family protein, partial [Syntrophales bacterium]|nr:folylpolyglutamate synthase/dihydrofolate synthase family protein [Syntrophales bacterium]